jgi:predicted Zn-dependent peptidase
MLYYVQMQKIKKIKLKNGLVVNFLIDKEFKTSSIQMLFKLGWRSDTEGVRGIAHLFEHLVAKRTNKYPEKSEFAKKLEVEGIVANAWTGPDSTVYYQDQIHEKLVASLELLFEGIYNTKFVEEDLEKEKGVVLNEAKRYLDDDDSVVWRETVSALYPKSTMTKFFFGDEMTMKNITLEHFRHFYEIYRNPKNSELFIATNSESHVRSVLTFLDQFFKGESVVLTKAKLPVFPENTKGQQMIKNISKPERMQANLHLGYKISKLSQKEEAVFIVFSRLYVGGLTSKLMLKLRDELGLIYSASLYSGHFKGGIDYINFATETHKDKKTEVLEVVKTAFKQIDKMISKEDIKNIFPRVEFNLQKPKNPHGDLDALMDSVIYKKKYLQRSESVKLLKSVTKKDLINFCKKYLRDKNYSVIVME